MSIKFNYTDSLTYKYQVQSPIGYQYTYGDSLTYQYQVSRKLSLTSALYELIKRNLVMMFANYTPLAQSPDYQLWYVPFTTFMSIQGAILYFDDGTTMNLPPSAVQASKIANGVLWTINITMTEVKNLVGVGVIINVMGANTFTTGVKGFLVTLTPGTYTISIQEYVQFGGNAPNSDFIDQQVIGLYITCATNPSECPQTWSTCLGNPVCSSKCLAPIVILAGIYLYGYDNTGNYYMVNYTDSVNNVSGNVSINTLPSPSGEVLIVNYQLSANMNNLKTYNPNIKYYCICTLLPQICVVGHGSFVTANPSNVNYSNPACVGQGQGVSISMQWVVYPPTF